MKKLKRKPLFCPEGDTDVRNRRIINGNTTNLNDFNHMKYTWVSDWYRQAMNNFWVPEEINLGADVKDYPKLTEEERRAYDKILSFLVFLDSIQTANLPALGEFITANEINLCLTIQAFQEAVHSQSYSYMLDTICEPQKRNEVLYQWKNDVHLLERNTFIGNIYNAFLEERSAENCQRRFLCVRKLYENSDRKLYSGRNLFLQWFYVFLQSWPESENAGICAGNPLYQSG